MLKGVWAASLGLLALFLFVCTLSAQSFATVVRDANLRAGPGTKYAIVGSAKAGESVVISGTNTAGDWYQLDTGKWIAAFLIKASDLVTATATITPTINATTTVMATSTKPASTTTPTRTPRPTRTPLPPPTATKTPDPSVALRFAIEAALGDSNRQVERVTKVEIGALGIINVEWAINDSFRLSNNARIESVEVLKAIHKSGLQRDLINMVGTFSMIDQFGNQSESPVVWLTFSVDTVNQINWDDEAFVLALLPKSIFEIADHSKIHSALSE